MSKNVVDEHTPITSSGFTIFKHGFISGVGWAFGVTVGFVLLSTVIVLILRALGGLPLVGSFIASIVEATQEQLYSRTPIFR